MRLSEILDLEKTDILSLRDYYPSKSGKVNSDTSKIMDLKDSRRGGHRSAVEYFGEILNNEVHKLINEWDTKTIQVAIVPSSTEGKKSTGLEAVLDHVKGVKLLYDKNFLVRFASILPAHKGGPRNMQLHLKTIIVLNKPDPEIPLLLLDDVTTSGGSMYACAELLRKSGVKQVKKLAIAKTVFV